MGVWDKGCLSKFCIVVFIICNLNPVTCTVVFSHPEEEDPGAAFHLGGRLGELTP